MIATVIVKDGRHKHEVTLTADEGETDEQLGERAITSLIEWDKLGTTVIKHSLQVESVERQAS